MCGSSFRLVPFLKELNQYSDTSLERLEDLQMLFCRYVLNPLTSLLLLVVVLPSLQAASLDPVQIEDGYVSIFDGQSLNGWNGNQELWRVEDGILIGETTSPLQATTYLIWQQGNLDDFELQLDYRITNGNSGIQYRSQDLGEFHVAGYQADMESGPNHSGILYDQGGRGVVTKRGERTIIEAGGIKKTGEPIDTSENLQSKIRSGDWNQYRIVARGTHLQHFINGELMSETTDQESEKRKASGILAFQLHAGQPMKVEFKNILLKRLRLTGNRKKLLLLAGRASHKQGAHEFRAGCLLFQKCLQNSIGEKLVTAVHTDGWPNDPTAFDNADAILLFSDGGKGHPVVQRNRLAQIDALAKRGVGIACLHYGVEVPKEKGGAEFLHWIGGFFETNWSVNPHWTLAATEIAKNHPICNGVKPFEVNDEWYYHMRFREPNDDVTKILTAIPPDSTRERPDGLHSNNPTVRSNKGHREVLAWAYDRPDGGRGFGCTGGHFHNNWANDDFRTLILNALVWTSGVTVPNNGITSHVSDIELTEDLDPPPPPRKKRKT